MPRAHALAVAAGFLLVPAVALWLMGRPIELGGLDLRLLAGVALYLSFTPVLVALIPANERFFEGFAAVGEGAGAVAAKALVVVLVVAPVDFFCRRVVQLESERIWGAWRGLVIATVVWLLGHVPEWLWLRDLMGGPGAFAFILIPGLLTGLLYMRHRNVAGLMLGHCALNWLVMAAALAILG